MRRREFIAGVGAAAAAGIAVRPSAAEERRRNPVVGYLSSVSAERDVLAPGFRQGLADLGFIEGRSVVIERRYADGDYGRLPALAQELVARPVDVIATGPASPAALAARSSTLTIPIVFSLGGDPVGLGLVESYNRPGGNATGINIAPESLTVKRMELLLDVMQSGTPVGELVNLANKQVDEEMRVATQAAHSLGREIVFAGASTDGEIDAAFAELDRQRAGGLLVWLEAFLTSRRDRIIALAERYKLPAVYPSRPYAEHGGVIAYGPDIAQTFRQFGVYVGKVLQGARPADLPVITPTKFELIISMKAAKSLGVAIPPTLLARADEVIE